MSNVVGSYLLGLVFSLISAIFTAFAFAFAFAFARATCFTAGSRRAEQLYSQTSGG